MNNDVISRLRSAKVRRFGGFSHKIRAISKETALYLM